MSLQRYLAAPLPEHGLPAVPAPQPAASRKPATAPDVPRPRAATAGTKPASALRQHTTKAAR
jgi:hypothetical protein